MIHTELLSMSCSHRVVLLLLSGPLSLDKTTNDLPPLKPLDLLRLDQLQAVASDGLSIELLLLSLAPLQQRTTTVQTLAR